jgi:Gylcosyl hydrolase family 115 C-terminal domain/Glycosyl hydrolase family 115
MEFPIDFFLKMAWNPEAMTLEAMQVFPLNWGTANFGSAVGGEVGELIGDYARLAARRKPELVDAQSFPLGTFGGGALDGGEFGRVVAEWDALATRMKSVRTKLDSKQHDAYFQLVEHPISAMANLYHLYYAVALNRQLAAANDPRANEFADRAELAFKRDEELRDTYHLLNGGKWDGMMLQTHLGYSAWNDPKTDIMPEVKRIKTGKPLARSIEFRSLPDRAGKVAVAEAGSYTRAVGGNGLEWKIVPRLGRNLGSVGAFPQGRPASTPADEIRLEYSMSLKKGGDATLRLFMVPALNTTGGKALQIAVSIDDRPMQILTLKLEVDGKEWEQVVRDNVAILEARFPRLSAGQHIVKIWRMDDNMFVQKLALYTGSLEPSYLGPTPRK